MQKLADFPFESVGQFTAELIKKAYSGKPFIAESKPDIHALPDDGEGEAGLQNALRDYLSGSAGLASEFAMGHMDTAPHPAAAFADALVSAVNNNLLFREISPFASRIEEFLVQDLGSRFGLLNDWHGTFVSGGSLANLTALFAATGGFGRETERDRCDAFLPPCAHASIKKSLSVLGIRNVHAIVGDDQGRFDLNALDWALRMSKAKHKIVVGVLGSTIHGAVENTAALVSLAERYGAWLHIDAIHGGALAFSNQFHSLLDGLDGADSVVAGPQKWLYVPRLSALVWVKGKQRFDSSLGVDLPYSISGDEHRGRWGLQGSRRADAVTLWAVLRYLGTRTLGETVDQSVNLCREFYRLLNESVHLKPSHAPDLNLQCFRFRDTAKSIEHEHQKLGKNGIPWVSLSHWQGEKLFRAVLLSPATKRTQLDALIAALAD
ncbi:MAG: pyridoxal-dependent decarboxylase [Pseudomonadota bacterium]